MNVLNIEELDNVNDHTILINIHVDTNKNSTKGEAIAQHLKGSIFT